MNDIVSTPIAAPADQQVVTPAFWPDIDVDSVRATIRIGGTSVSQERLVDAIRFAVIDVTRPLTAWRVEQQANGFDTLAAIDPDTQVDGVTELELLFLRAVAMTAGAELADRYPDITATREGADRAETIMSVADDYRRSATRAVRALRGETGTSVELI